MRHSLERIPPELLLQIASYCTIGSLAGLAQTCRRFHDSFNATLYETGLNEEHARECIVWAAERGRLESIKRAYSYCTDLGVQWPLYLVDEPWARQLSLSALFVALRHQRDDTFLYLLDRCSEPHKLPGIKVDPCTENVRDIFSVSRRHTDSWYLLHFAIMHRSSDWQLAAALIAKGAYRSSWSVPALHDVVATGDMRLFDLLVAQAETKLTDIDSFSQTTLHYATELVDCEATCRSMITRLVDAGVPIDAENVEDNTALDHAFYRRNFTAVETLLDLGANFPSRDIHGWSTLHKVIRLGEAARPSQASRSSKRRVGMIQCLINTGANVNHCSFSHGAIDGSPLLFAACQDHIDMSLVECLLKNGARADMPAYSLVSQTTTIIDALIMQNHLKGVSKCVNEWELEKIRDVIALLLRNGARIDPIDDAECKRWEETCDCAFYYDDYTPATSAFQNACGAMVRRNGACLRMLLQYATKDNVSLRHLQDVLNLGLDDYSNYESEDCTWDGYQEVQRLIKDFIAREYPGAAIAEDA